MAGMRGRLGRALGQARGQAGGLRGPLHGLGASGVGRRGVEGRGWRDGRGAAQTSVLMLRLRAKASRMAERRLGLSGCRPPKAAGGSSMSSWLMAR